MSSDRWHQIEELYHAALRLDANQRAGFLESACNGDEGLRREVESLLTADQQAENFLESPVLEVAAVEMATQGPPSLIGRSLGAYQILSALGAGGMGEVYKAKDTRLNRIVAIKVLPRHLSERPALRQRLEREARTIASLNHPHICALYDIGREDGIDFLVMEYLEGETLAGRLRRGALPLDQALRYAVEIAQALDEAHRHGVIHRDLKPGNVMLNKSGVKLLDFGLAKRLMSSLTTGTTGVPAAESESLTEEGVILGTLEYMAPEQVEGKPADARTDIFAVGLVIYEMATGKKAFQGESKASLAAAILTSDPVPIREIEPSAPIALGRALGKCLNKDPQERWQTARDLSSELKWMLEDLASSGTSAASRTPRPDGQKALPVGELIRARNHGVNPEFIQELRREGYDSVSLDELIRLRNHGVTAEFIQRMKSQGFPRLSIAKRTTRLVGIAAALALAAAGALWFYFAKMSQSFPPMRVSRVTSYPGLETEPALSPDGKMVAFVWNGENQDNWDIYVKLIDEGVPVRLTRDPADDLSPTWSPDGGLIAFRRQSAGRGGIYLVPSLGGKERMISELVGGVNFKSLDWSPNGKFLASSERHSLAVPPGIFLLAVDTGEKKPLTSGLFDYDPAFSPDGESLLFTRASGSMSRLYRVPVAGGEPRRVIYDDTESSSGVWTPGGTEIIFCGSGYETGLFRVKARGGKPQPLSPGGQFGFYPSISRQGHRLVYSEQTYDTDIWRLDLSPALNGKPSALTRLISSTRLEDTPNFSPDRKRIVFSSNRSGHWEVWVCDSDGRNSVQLTSFGGPFITGTPRWSPDGKTIVFDSRPRGKSDIFVINAESRAQQNLTADAYENMVPSWSRDGRWIYFSSTRGGDGEFQVWKMPVEGGQPIQVTKKGGWEAFESFDGTTVYYSKTVDRNAIWKVPTAGGEETRFLANTWHRYWTVGEKGIYFITREDRFLNVNFISFADEQIIRLARFERTPAKDGGAGLALSPDGLSLLWTLPEGYNSDIMLVENFR
jgi:eukaryotic-like serine/threonine-protein kinase